MTTTEQPPVSASETMRANLARIEALTKRLFEALAQRRQPNPALEGPGLDLYMTTGAALLKDMSENPARILEAQVSFWSQAVKHYADASQALSKSMGKAADAAATAAAAGSAAPETPAPKEASTDKRFANPLWTSHPYFNFVKQQYLNSVRLIEEAVLRIEGLDDINRRRLETFSRQLIDMMAPTNFLATNPDALERAVATEGESLVRGLENLVRDIEENRGDLLVTLADRTAFKVGWNIGTAEGSVVYRNRMFELIQYKPTTETVRATPLLIFPPWINKFYILDLKPANSLIRWLVDQGYTLFVVSWKNPDPSYADVGLDTYITEGFLEAIAQVKSITGEPQVNAVGYCIAGTTLSLTLALMEKLGDRSITSASFFTTLTDFSDLGEFTAYLQEDFLTGIEEQVKLDGVLSSYFMSRTFSFLRANDLIYRPAIRSYMMGEAPPAFDLLYWNGDSTNLPGRMAREYLRGLCQQNRFTTPQGLNILGQQLKISDVHVPLCAIACETDHIAPWIASFNGIAQMGSGERMFILSESGHVAGIVNPPSKRKYGHFTSEAPIADPTEWKEQAVRHEGSWWPRWDEWLARRSGQMVPARIPGGSGHPELLPAPGSYVTEVVTP